MIIFNFEVIYVFGNDMMMMMMIMMIIIIIIIIIIIEIGVPPDALRRVYQGFLYCQVSEGFMVHLQL